MSNKLSEEINHAAEKLRGMDNLIPPIPKINVDDQALKEIQDLQEKYPGKVSYVEDLPPFIRQPLIFTNGFIDCALALCFCLSLVCVGMAVGINLR